MGLGGPGWGGKEGRRGGEGPAGSRLCVSSSLGHQSQPPRHLLHHGSPKQPSAPRQRRGASGRPHQFREPKAESTPPLAKGEAETGSAHTSTRAHRPRARPLRFRAAPARWRGGGRSGQAGVWRREPQKGFPAWANVVLASRGERGSGRPKTTPAAWPPLGPQLRQSPRAGRRSAQGSRRPESLGVRRGARRGGEREEEEEEGEAESWRPGCERKAVCGHVVRYVPRARAAIRSRATSKPGARLSRLPPRSAPPSLLPSCVSRRAHQYGQRREAPPGQRHPAFGLQPAPPRPAPDSPRAPRLRTPLLFRMPLFAFARGRAGFHLRPGVITGDTLSPPRRPRSSRIRSA